MTVTEIFAAAGLVPAGSVVWGEPVEDRHPGVYVVTLDDVVVYVGRTSAQLRKRVRQFYRHRHGQRSPHRGGQDVLQMDGVKRVHWAPTASFEEAEHLMIEAYRSVYGALPPANKLRIRGRRRTGGSRPAS